MSFEWNKAIQKMNEDKKSDAVGLSATNALLCVDTADKRPQLGHWAPGNYEHECYLCGTKFLGDKRAGTCAPCEYKDT